jgi:hypothetical protein
MTTDCMIAVFGNFANRNGYGLDWFPDATNATCDGIVRFCTLRQPFFVQAPSVFHDFELLPRR